MKIIKKLARMIEEEIHDADKYARCALEYKDEWPELAQTFVSLSNAELEHMGILHTAVTNLIEEERRTHGDPPAGMLEAYNFIHEWQLSHVAEIRSMLRTARE